ncbi:MAG TPA: methyltransferase domain-containing protein [Burkholderiales bacterium]|nr:methyltransferase domain-containing protein [Burkholderiales bacterium]
MNLKTSPTVAARKAVEASALRILGSEEGPSLKDYWKYHAARLALDFDWTVKTVDKSAAVLEIGGFPFFLTAALSDAGYRVQTVDKLSPSAGRLAEQLKISVCTCDIETEALPFESNSFDVVLFNEVFEHLRIDPIFTVDALHRVLKPGGRLWLSTPNLKSLKGMFNFLFKSEAWGIIGDGVYAQYEHLRTQGWMGHVREYTSKEVSDFLRSCGFEIEKIAYRGRYKNPVAQSIATALPPLKPYFSVVAKK